MFKTVEDIPLKGKRVILRADFNVPMAGDNILDDFRIRKIIPTIEYLKSHKAKIIIISHLGRPLNDPRLSKNWRNYSLKPIALKLEELLKTPVGFINDCCGRAVVKKIEKIKEGDIVLLENLRFYAGEEKNSPDFAKKLAKLGELYVSEAFSVSHRLHASIVILPRLMPRAVGFAFAEEVKVLSKLRDKPLRPYVVIIGGAKIASKMKAVQKLLKKADYLLFGGKTANVILRVKGICVGKPWPDNEEAVKEIKQLKLTNTAIHLPVDVIVSPDRSGKVYLRDIGPGKVRKDENIFDIGKETVKTFNKIIAEAKTIVWAGPLGLIEEKQFQAGTKGIIESISRNHQAFKVAGGGDTIETIQNLSSLKRFSYISTGGSAMLFFLAGEKLPGIEALKG